MRMDQYLLLSNFFLKAFLITLHFTLHDLSENELQAGNFSCFFTNAYIVFPSAIRNCFLFPSGPGLWENIKQNLNYLISYCQAPGQLKLFFRSTLGPALARKRTRQGPGPRTGA